jgi:arsenate reductase (thioredoxin)
MGRISILVLCTGNSARSQMAEGILRSLDPTLDVQSAGTQPADHVHPMAITVMKEIGFDIASAKTKNVAEFLGHDYDYVITVCDNARQTCPVFKGRVGRSIHYGFEDPAVFEGNVEQQLVKFRQIRDEIKQRMCEFLQGARNHKPLLQNFEFEVR